MPLPLADLRVIALEQYGAGPFGSLHLADLGADVIKVEDPAAGGDVGRDVPPYAEQGTSLFFETFNRNKRSIALDLANAAGRGVFEDLVRNADAVYSNLRGDVPAKLRIRYADLAHVNPRIVCCALTAFGMTGPRSAEPGYDYILQGMAGWMSLTGEPDGPPTKTGPSLVDYSGGLVAICALLAGVHAARRDGVGGDCDVSLFDTAIGLLGYPLTWQASRGRAPTRTASSAHPSLVPFQNFATADGWIVIACAKEKFWQRLTQAIGRPDLADDARFARFDDRRVNASALLPILDEVFASRPTSEWLVALADAGVPCGPVNTVADVIDDPHTAARGDVVTTTHPVLGVVRAPASPVRVGPPRGEHRPSPAFAADTGAILTDVLGYGAERKAELAAAGAFGAGG